MFIETVSDPQESSDVIAYTRCTFRRQAILVRYSCIFRMADQNTDPSASSHRGNRALIGIVCGNIVLFILTKLYFVQRNRKRDLRWNAMTIAQKEEYLRTTTDKGNKRYVKLRTMKAGADLDHRVDWTSVSCTRKLKTGIFVGLGCDRYAVCRNRS